MVTGGAVRWRLYRGFDLEPARIFAVGVLCTLTFWLGVATVAGFSLLLDPSALAPIDGHGGRLGLVIGGCHPRRDRGLDGDFALSGRAA